jgi:hypothetical protein
VGQSAILKEQRQPGVIRARLTAVKDTVATAAGLATLWEKVQPYLETLLG